LRQSTSFATSYPFLQIYLKYDKAAHPEPPQGQFLKLCVQAFFLIHLLFLLAIRLSEELLKLDILILSLSSGDEKIFNSDGTKIEIDDQNTAAPSFSSQFFPPPANYSAGMYGNAYNQPSSFAPGTNNHAHPNFNYPPPNGYPSYADVSQPSEAPTAQSSALPEQSTEDPHAATIEYALFYLSNRFTNSLIL
jgi:hypothetical protein